MNKPLMATLPSDERTSLEEYNDPFLLGIIASLFCSLRHTANRNCSSYNDEAILNLARSNPVSFIGTMGTSILRYAQMLRCGTNAWQCKMIDDCFNKLSSDIYSLKINDTSRACVSCGFHKQNHLINLYRLEARAKKEAKKESDNHGN